MDPNANLQEQRRMIAWLIARYEDGHYQSEEAMRLVELVEALDEWLSKGGFLPSEWSKGR